MTEHYITGIPFAYW